MSCSRTDDSRRVDWSHVSGNADGRMRYQLLRFVHGIRKPRENPVTKKQILAWFHGTPRDFVEQAIRAAITLDEIMVYRTGLVRRTDQRYAYEVTDAGRMAVTSTGTDRRPS